LLTYCNGGDAKQAPLLDATVAFPPRDTSHFSLPATTHHCTDGQTLLLEAVSPEGSGVLVRLHFRDSLGSGSYRVVMPGDTTAPAAVVAVRYLVRDVARAFVFDTGTVQLRREGAKLSGNIQGSGIENAIRTPTHIEYYEVPLPVATDTVPCAFQP
jgi:hypothetical protein